LQFIGGIFDFASSVKTGMTVWPRGVDQGRRARRAMRADLDPAGRLNVRPR
jgi:hypothetical protein